jgi:hypothetical protein
VTGQCEEKWIRIFTHLYDDWPCRKDGSNVANYLQRIRIFIHFCSDQICRSEGSNMVVCLPIELFQINCNMDCWLTIKVNLKYLFLLWNHPLIILATSRALNFLLFKWFQSSHLFILCYWINVHCSQQPVDIWHNWISIPLLLAGKHAYTDTTYFTQYL